MPIKTKTKSPIWSYHRSDLEVRVIMGEDQVKITRENLQVTMPHIREWQELR